jgi:hypothetical protein
MSKSTELTLEQELSIRCFSDQVQIMPREQAQTFLIEQYRLMLVQQTMYQALLKQAWQFDVESDPL